MPPKTPNKKKDKKNGDGKLCMSTGKPKGGKKGASPGWKVRQLSPIGNALLTPKEVKDKFMISAADVMRWKAKRDKTELDGKSEELKQNENVPYSAWWPTANIILPTDVHFPPAKTGKGEKDTAMEANTGMGLIRPVSITAIEALKASFVENGGAYDANRPVCSCCYNCCHTSNLLELFYAPDICLPCVVNLFQYVICDVYLFIPHQVWIVPFIEDNPKACEEYNADEGAFWMRVFDLVDEYHHLPMLVCDGAHRREVCFLMDLKDMRSNFLKPTISLAELVCFTLYMNE